MKKSFFIKWAVIVMALAVMLFLMATVFQPHFSQEMEQQIQQKTGLSLKIKGQHNRLFPQSIFLSNIQVEGDISGEIPEAQIDFSLLSVFSRNKRITNVILKNPKLTVQTDKNKGNPLLQTLFKKNSFSFNFPIEIHNGSVDYQRQTDSVSLTNISLNLLPTTQALSASGTFKLKGQSFTLAQLKVMPQKNRDILVTHGRISRGKNQFDFSLTFAPRRTQGFVTFSLTEAKKILDTDLFPFLTDHFEAVISIDFENKRRSFPSIIMRFEENGKQTALTGNLLWQYDLRNAFQNAISGKLVIRELSGNLRDLLDSYLNWEKIQSIDKLNKIDLDLTFQRVPIKDIFLKNFSLKLTGNTSQIFVSDAKATLSTGGNILFDASLDKESKTPSLKIRFNGTTENARPLIAWLVDVQNVPENLLKNASASGEIDATPKDLKLNLNQLSIDAAYLNGQFNWIYPEKKVQINARVKDLNLDNYIPFKAQEEFPVEQLPTHLQQWFVAHWPKTDKELYINLFVKDSFYSNFPIESFGFMGKIKENTLEIAKLKFFNVAGLRLESSGKISLKENQLEIPDDFSLKINTDSLASFLQRANISPVTQKSIMFDGKLSLQNNQLSIKGVFQKNDDPNENIEKQIDL